MKKNSILSSFLVLGLAILVVSPWFYERGVISVADASGKSIRQAKRQQRRTAKKVEVVTVENLPVDPVSTDSSSTTLQDTTTFFEIFNGYGTVEADTNAKSVHLLPLAATTPGETHAGLVRTNVWMTGDYRIAATITTNAQLRTGSTPNPWEVAWLPFGYNEDGTFKYLIFKPNGYGIELGESLGNNAQNFLWTSPIGAHQFPIQTAYDVVVEVRGKVITVSVNGSTMLTYTETARDHLDTDGYVGFYSEDADVNFTNISITSL